LNKY